MAETTFDSYGKLFFKQGRNHFWKKCVILCIARFTYQDSNREIDNKFVNFGRRGKHAEEIVFRRIEEEERKHNW